MADFSVASKLLLLVLLVVLVLVLVLLLLVVQFLVFCFYFNFPDPIGYSIMLVGILSFKPPLHLIQLKNKTRNSTFLFASTISFAAYSLIPYIFEQAFPVFLPN